MFSEIFSGRCPACSGASALNMPLCNDCIDKLETYEYFCSRCGFPLSKPGSSCYKCNGRLSKHITNLYALYHYNKSIRGLLLNIKFSYNIRSALTFKKLVHLPDFKTQYDGVVTVPSHFLRHFYRFYHPAVILGEITAEKLNVPILKNLKRSRYTSFQSHLLKKQRYDNVKGAFRCTAFNDEIKNILLIDDIFTTGATINECVSVLKKAGAERIDVLVFAK